MSSIQVTQTGEEQLSPEERDLLRRLFSFPEEIPKVFPSWMIEYMKINGQFDKRQVTGLANFDVYPATEITDEDTVAVGQTTFTALAHVGPSLTGLSNGLYIVQFGGLARAGQSDGSYAIESIAVNGTVTSDEIWSGANFSSVNKMAHVTLDNGDNNSIVAKYRRFGGSFAVTWRQRWMVAIRYGTL